MGKSRANDLNIRVLLMYPTLLFLKLATCLDHELHVDIYERYLYLFGGKNFMNSKQW